MKILALDLGMTKTVACLLDCKTNDPTYYTIRTSPEDVHDLLAEVEPERVVFEICTIAGWVHDLCEQFGCKIEVANPCHEAWRWRNVKRKTDRLDAQKLARLSAMNQIPTVHVPTSEVRQWRSLIGFRYTLVRRRTRIKNHIRALLRTHNVRLQRGRSGWTGDSLAMLRDLASSQETMDSQDLWRVELAIELDQYDAITHAITEIEEKLDAVAKKRDSVRRIQTIPGVGPRLAECLVALIDDPRRFRSGRQIGSYAGLTPKQYQSGETDRRGRITRQGNPLLRALLVEVSWIGLRHNLAIRAVYERTCRNSRTRRKVAIVAAARRLLVWAWAMLRDETTWQPRHGPVAPAA